MPQSLRHYSLDDYFAVETDSLVKHEYLSGEIFAMAGASVQHNHITANVLALLRTRLRASGCSSFGSDLRIGTPGGFYTYPDVSVICGPVELVAGRPDTATNPTLLVEVLSNATRDYDRGEKFELYKTIPTLRDYVLIEQDVVAIEHFMREDKDAWVVMDVEKHVHFSSVPVTLSSREIYEEVFAI